MGDEREVSGTDKFGFILSAVEKIREKRGIIPTPESKLEGSCFGASGGEMANMFWAQLLYTPNGSGEWKMLTDPAILESLYDYVSLLEFENNS